MEDIELYVSVAIIELALIKKDINYKTNWHGFMLRCGIRSDQEEILITTLDILKNKYSFLKSWKRKEDLLEIKINSEKPLPKLGSIKLEKLKELPLRRSLLFRLYEQYRKENFIKALHSLIEETTSLEVSKEDIQREVEYMRNQNLLEYELADGGACTSNLSDYGLELCDSLENLFSAFETLSPNMTEKIVVGEESKTDYEEIKGDPKKVFVVHGRNLKAKDAMFQFVRSIDLQPIEWSQAVKATGKGTPYVGEVLDVALGIAQAIIILVTGDDIAQLREKYIRKDDPDYEKELTPQARPNVIFEAGLAFGRSPDRTILVELEKEKTRQFSDIYGRHYVRLSNAPDKRVELLSRLKTAGCEIDIEAKKDWTKTGDFDGAVVEYQPNKKEEKLESSDEIILILNALANQKDRMLEQRNLEYSYFQKFKGKKVSDFQIILNDLDKYNLIYETECGDFDEICWVITPKGIEYLKFNRRG